MNVSVVAPALTSVNFINHEFDSTSPFITSGIRLGTPACTTRGFKEKEFIIVGNLIADILDALQASEYDSSIEEATYKKVLELTKQFPIYH